MMSNGPIDQVIETLQGILQSSVDDQVKLRAAELILAYSSLIPKAEPEVPDQA